MITARYRHPQYDKLRYTPKLTRGRLAAGETITGFNRSDAQQSIFFTDEVAITPDGQGLTFMGWGGFANNTHTVRFTLETSALQVIDMLLQFTIDAPLCAECAPEPPPGWPFPPPSVNDNIDVGEFDLSNNTGNCPTP